MTSPIGRAAWIFSLVFFRGFPCISYRSDVIDDFVCCKMDRKQFRLLGGAASKKSSIFQFWQPRVNIDVVLKHFLLVKSYSKCSVWLETTLQKSHFKDLGGCFNPKMSYDINLTPKSIFFHQTAQYEPSSVLVSATRRVIWTRAQETRKKSENALHVMFHNVWVAVALLIAIIFVIFQDPANQSIGQNFASIG